MCRALMQNEIITKTIARNAFKNCTKTVLDRSNNQFFRAVVSDKHLLSEVYLYNPKRCDLYEHILPPRAEVMFSRKIVCQVGHISSGQYLYVFEESARIGSTRSPVLCLAEYFLEVSCPHFASVRFFVGCTPYAVLKPGLWRKNRNKRCVAVQHVLQKAVVFLDANEPDFASVIAM